MSGVVTVVSTARNLRVRYERLSYIKILLVSSTSRTKAYEELRR